LLLASLWGASYLFIKVALDDVSPAVIVFVRTALAALVLFPYAQRTGAFAGVRGALGTIAVLAAIQIAGPFLLRSAGEREISSSLAGILVAGAPIWTFLLAIRIDAAERVHGVGLAGVLAGIAGVALLLGFDTGGGSAALVGGLMVVLASLGYALGAFWFKRRLAGLEPIGVVAAAMALAALMTIPFVALALPDHTPAADTVGSLAALSVLGTGIAFVIFYTLIAEIGPGKASLVAYLAPAFAVFYGVTLLDESFTASTLAGQMLIVGGSWLAAEGRLPWKAKAEPAWS
jgi:drug/metabolite transporter (DMT)-like permease